MLHLKGVKMRNVMFDRTRYALVVATSFVFLFSASGVAMAVSTQTEKTMQKLGGILNKYAFTSDKKLVIMTAVRGSADYPASAKIKGLSVALEAKEFNKQASDALADKLEDLLKAYAKGLATPFELKNKIDAINDELEKHTITTNDISTFKTDFMADCASCKIDIDSAVTATKINGAIYDKAAFIKEADNVLNSVLIDTKSETSLTEQQKAVNDFLGGNWGGGLAVNRWDNADTGVKGAKVDKTGTIRVTSRQNVEQRLMLETHYLSPFYGENRWHYLDCGTKDNPGCGLGIYLGIEPGGENTFKSFALGVMLGLRNQYMWTTRHNFNVGLGLVFEPSAQFPANGMEADKMHPSCVYANPKSPTSDEKAACDNATVDYIFRDRTGINLMFSFTW